MFLDCISLRVLLVCHFFSSSSVQYYLYNVLFFLQSIIFIRDHGACGQEISGYIDYAHRLKREDFKPYFSGEKKLLPRPNDLR